MILKRCQLLVNLKINCDKFMKRHEMMINFKIKINYVLMKLNITNIFKVLNSEKKNSFENEIKIEFHIQTRA